MFSWLCSLCPCAALLRGPDQFCCFCARTGSGKQSPPADFLLVLRSWFALALCVLVLCFGFVLISFCYLLCVHRHRQSDPPGRLSLIFALLVRFRGCVFCVLVFCFVSCVECWSRHHMCSAVYVCVRLLLCMRVCVLSVRLCLCVSMRMCVLSVRLGLAVRCALVFGCVSVFGVCLCPAVCVCVFGVCLCLTICLVGACVW